MTTATQPEVQAWIRTGDCAFINAAHVRTFFVRPDTDIYTDKTSYQIIARFSLTGAGEYNCEDSAILSTHPTKNDAEICLNRLMARLPCGVIDMVIEVVK